MPSDREPRGAVEIMEAAYDHLVFDCDGVILDSNAVKTEAFREIARPHGASAAEALVAYHLEHGGETRQEKMRVFVEQILERPPDADARKTAEELVSRFGEACRKALSQCATVPGVEAFLERCAGRIPCYVVTGGSQAEVRSLFAERGLDRHFEAILGNPASKRDNMRRLAEGGAFVGRGLYFGDAALDRELAIEFGQDFCFVADRSDWSEGRAVCAATPGTRTIPDFTELAAALPAPRPDAR